jgi:hypothetical protein
VSNSSPPGSTDSCDNRGAIGTEDGRGEGSRREKYQKVGGTIILSEVSQAHKVKNHMFYHSE